MCLRLEGLTSIMRMYSRAFCVSFPLLHNKILIPLCNARAEMRKTNTDTDTDTDKDTDTRTHVHTHIFVIIM